MSHVKYDRHVDREHLDWVKTKKCLNCGQHPVDPHHAWSSGGGNKKNDFLGLPICRECHQQCHHIGEESWQRKTGLYYEFEVIRMLIRRIKELNAKRP